MLISLIFLSLLFWYSLQFFTLGINTEVMNTFIHGVNLVFHEAGHVIFMPLGEFMTILGGSLFQCLLPFALMIVFLKQEESSWLGAIFCLWWTGQNMTDVALYISDASTRNLPLIGGMSEDAHDWGNLLTMTNLLSYDHTLAIIVHYAGLFCMMAAFFFGTRKILGEYFSQGEPKNTQKIKNEFSEENPF